MAKSFLNIDSKSIPAASGIYNVSDVKVLKRGEDMYEFAGAGRSMYGMAEVKAVVYCRAQKFALEHHYGEWKADEFKVRLEGTPTALHLVDSVLTFLPPKDGHEGPEKDWCKKVPIGTNQ